MALTDADVRAFADRVERDLGLQQFDVYLSNGGYLNLSLLVVPRDRRNEGLGSEAMERLIRFADEHNKMVVLKPAQRDPHHGTTSRTRLVKFYKQFGFIENKGRGKDFTLDAGSMYRLPRSRHNQQSGRWSIGQRFGRL